MIGVCGYFSDLKEIGDLEVVLGDDSVVKEFGSGIVSFQRDFLPPMLLRDVIYVRGLKKNLVLVSTIADRGNEVLFHNVHVFLYPNVYCVTSAKVTGIQHEKLYKLMLHPVRALMHSTNNGDLCEIWHRRMAHLHHGDLGILREIVNGVPEFNTEHQEVCKGCVIGKYAKTSFPSSDNKVTGILDLIHTDVCGPMSFASLSGFLYYATFIDDFSRESWIFFMKTKGQVFQRFQYFKDFVENQTGKKIKVLRFDISPMSSTNFVLGRALREK
jgi:hypothetical protein